MKRVHIICEGQTEESFVNALLAPHLARFSVFPSASLIGTTGHKGGNVSTPRMLGDIKRRIQGDPTAHCTTFFDFYGLHPDFVGKAAALGKPDIQTKAKTIEAALHAEVLAIVGHEGIRRFTPYIQMYEFEALLFSHPEKMARGLYAPGHTSAFSAIRAGFLTPEEINNSRETAPSKRILKLIPGYDKVTGGSLAALEIGLDDMRRECSRFDAWVAGLEAL